MSDDKKETPKKKPKRMMARKDFKVLRDLVKEQTEAQKAYNEALVKLCDDNGDKDWWPDKVKSGLGFVLVTREVQREAQGDGEATSEKIVERQRISPEDRATLKEVAEKLDSVKDRIEKKIIAIAIKAGVPTNYVDAGTGEITTERVEECDPAEEGD